MSKTDAIAEMLKQLNAKQLQTLLSATGNRDGSQIRAKKNAQTQAYFDRVKAEGLYPHKYDTFTQFREVLE
jgi:hypothetical protein